jgi:GTP-binding protein
MNIISAEYVKSFPAIRGFDLPELPVIAFIGRSNVGKSSLINNLLNRKKLVKTSSTPGKTQLLNFFLINKQFYFVDLPGYGFANVPVKVKIGWLAMIQDFLYQYPQLKLIVQLLDIRHNPSNEDLEFSRLLAESQLPSLIVANKSDKVKRSMLKKSLVNIQNRLGLDEIPLMHSALKKTGKEEIWKELDRCLLT